MGTAAELGVFLLIPLLAGFWFLETARLTRFALARQSGYRLFFYSAAAGFVLWLISTSLLSITGWSDTGWLTAFLGTLGLAAYPHAAPLAGCMAIALILPLLLNPVTNSERVAARSAKGSGDFIEWIISESQRKRQLVEISTKSRKSYVGWAVESGVLTPGETDITLIPFVSGYRDKDTCELIFTTYYEDVLSLFGQDDKEGAEPGGMGDLTLKDFEIALPVSEIMSARLFDPIVYEQFGHRQDSIPTKVWPTARDGVGNAEFLETM